MSESIQPDCTIHVSVIMMCVGCVSLTLFPLLELICLIYGDIKGRLPLLYTNLKIIEVIALILSHVTTTAIVIIINVSPSFLIRVNPHPPLHHSMKLGNHFFEDDVYFSPKNLIQLIRKSITIHIHYSWMRRDSLLKTYHVFLLFGFCVNIAYLLLRENTERYGCDDCATTFSNSW